MTIAENQNQGNETEAPAEAPKKMGFFTTEELDLLDIPEPGMGGGKGQKMGLTQTAIIVLVLTAIASFALGMLAERSIDNNSGVAGNETAQGTDANLTNGTAPSSNAVGPQIQMIVPQNSVATTTAK